MAPQRFQIVAGIPRALGAYRTSEADAGNGAGRQALGRISPSAHLRAEQGDRQIAQSTTDIVDPAEDASRRK
ncbi:protein of unknown function [Methylocella tundrae]|uniref:Uncharacterized protein n=1 Tax=Methylocella tundrae TaxID=227605 RepID=A0A4U8Z0M8_METTU|nr:protein of unknown function [Methylocella tundrae]